MDLQFVEGFAGHSSMDPPTAERQLAGRSSMDLPFAEELLGGCSLSDQPFVAEFAGHSSMNLSFVGQLAEQGCRRFAPELVE